MKNRLIAVQSAFPSRTRPLLMTGLVAGDPVLEATRSYMDVLVAQGVDIIELIVPFSDPAYHGPVLRRACRRAMSEKVGWDAVKELLTDFRRSHDEIPIVVSSYFNRILARGEQQCAQELAQAGVDGVMVVDLPNEEAGVFKREVEQRDMVLIQTVASTTTKQRFRHLEKHARGVMVWTGHCGADVTMSSPDFQQRVRDLRQYTSLPILASMNIETGEEAATVARAAHGVLASSSLAWLIEGKGPNVEERLAAFVAHLRADLDAIAE